MWAVMAYALSLKHDHERCQKILRSPAWLRGRCDLICQPDLFDFAQNLLLALACVPVTQHKMLVGHG
jgi:hypothetical protein